MKKETRLLIIIFLIFTSCVTTRKEKERANSKLKLEDFVFMEQELPDNSKLKQVIDNEHLPCNAPTNPLVSSESSFLDCFVKLLVRDATLTQNVKKGLFSVYENNAEIGVFGLETDSYKTAKLISENIILNKHIYGGSEIIQSGNIVILLWHDNIESKTFNGFKKLIYDEIE